MFRGERYLMKMNVNSLSYVKVELPSNRSESREHGYEFVK